MSILRLWNNVDVPLLPMSLYCIVRYDVLTSTTYRISSYSLYIFIWIPFLICHICLSVTALTMTILWVLLLRNWNVWQFNSKQQPLLVNERLIITINYEFRRMDFVYSCFFVAFCCWEGDFQSSHLMKCKFFFAFIQNDTTFSWNEYASAHACGRARIKSKASDLNWFL